jgi:PTH1 family peptidyl-tRNA hydrolase
MYVLAGLGNPGSQYAMNRHNIGFMVIDLIADTFNFPPFKNKFKAEITEGRIGNHKVILCKPQTFMNRSGISLSELMGFYKIPLDHLYVFHDELDIAPFRVKMKKGGGSGGHNGLTSLDQYIGKDYWRIRLGIGHPGHKDAVTGYVLGNFRGDEEDALCEMLSAVSAETPTLLGADTGIWLTKLALRLTPPPKN